MKNTIDDLYDSIQTLTLRVEFLTKVLEQRQALSHLVLSNINQKSHSNIIEELKEKGLLLPVE